MALSVENICAELTRIRLLNPDEIRDLRARWGKSAGAKVNEADAFQRWLIANNVLTEYQLGVVARGNADQLLLGPYTIEERIGKGRMAGVYRARHRIGQIVAIKILPPSKAKDPQILARFQREARLSLRLKHPNVVRTFQSGESNGLHFLVMEHLEGEPLDETLARRGPLPPAEAVRLVYQALHGLDELHEKGMIHRDIKPGNLFLVGGQPDDTSEAIVKILDIGTGRATFDEGEGAGELTNEGDLLGTPAYMAPEQSRDARTADVRADIYSAGCILYHALAGRPPFNDTNPVRLLVKHATEPPPLLRQFTSNVPGELQQIISGMLAKDPASRYATPNKAAQALQTFLAVNARLAQQDIAPSMRAYLGELSKENHESINVELVAIALPTARVGPNQIPVAEVISTRSTAKEVPVATPVAATPVATAPKPEPARREPARREAPPREGPVSRAPAPPPPPPKAKSKPPARARRQEEDEEEEENTKSGISTRDLMMLLIGVGGLAVLLSLALALYAVFGIRRTPAVVPEPPPQKKDE